MSQRSSHRYNTAVRKLTKQNNLLGSGDFVGAFDFRPHRSSEQERDEFRLSATKPTMICPDGSRVWSF